MILKTSRPSDALIVDVCAVRGAEIPEYKGRAVALDLRMVARHLRIVDGDLVADVALEADRSRSM